MVEYVWALHDFSPEHEDEISFKAGDPIEIVEKDDQYGDGWWQGRTPDGQVGLFPQAYTTITPPSQQLSNVPEPRMPPTLDSLPEEPDESTSLSRDNAMMAATMTDVQHALDQLAVARGVGADDTSRRTFSFIESGTETDHDTTGDEEDYAQSPEGMRRNSRQLLAQNAAKANQRAAAAEASNDRLAPPLPVEMSDESEPEEDDITSPLHSPPETARAANFGPHDDLRTPLPPGVVKSAVHEEPPNSPPKHAEELAPEVAPVPPSPPRSPLRSPIALQVAPAEDAPASAIESQFITATTSSASSLQSPITPSPPGAFANEPKLYSEPDPATMPKSPTVAEVPQSAIPPEVKATPKPRVFEPPAPVEFLQSKEEEPAAATPSMGSLATVMQAPASPKPVQPQLASPITFPSIHSPMPSMPTATIVTQQLQRVLTPVQPTPLSAHFPAQMNASPTGSYRFQPPGSSPGSAVPSLIGSLEIPSKSNPMDWTVEQVVEWLKCKKFDDGIVAKFIENDITGDVLLELDVNMLKELDIAAFGKRMRIANAINELRRSLVTENSPIGIPNSRSGFTMPSSLNTSINPFNAGPISSGSMHNYLTQQQFQTPSPAMSLGPFEPGPAFEYPTTIPTGSQGPPSSTHTRNQSMSSMAPSGFGGDTVATDATSVTGGAQLPSAPPAQLTHVPEEENKTGLTAEPAPPMSSSVSAPPPTTAANVDEEPQVVLRKGSLRSKPPLATLTPVDRSASGVVPVWAGGQSQTTLSSVPQSAATEPTRPDKGLETDVESPPRKSADERATMSDGEATTGGGLKDLKRRMSTRKAVRESAHSFISAGSDERAPTPLSSVAASPSVKGSVFPGSLSVRRKRNSDEGTANGSASGKPKGERLSFFGGTLGKGRKPVPSEYSDTSPPVSEKAHTHRSLSSRLYLGSHGRKGHVRPAPSPGSGEAQSLPSSPAARLDAATTLSKTPDGVVLMGRIASSPPEAVPSGRRPAPPPPAPLQLEAKPGMTALDQIGQPDHSGWMRKRGESFNAWKLRYFVLKGPHLYCVKTLNEARIKGYINITGYKVVADENVHPGRYGFRIVHDTEKPHYFSSVEQTVVREWMKALMKATIGRDYSRPVVSSCNIPTIPLSIAQTMNPPPRPPSPTARAATQRATRRENTNQLSSRDALVLMGMAGEPDSTDKARLDQFFREPSVGNAADAPPRPSRELRRAPSVRAPDAVRDSGNSASDMELISWINNNLASNVPPATDLSTSLASGLILYRLAESIKGLPTDVPDSIFDIDGPDGMFKLFDFMLDNDVRIGNVSINDVRLGNKEKITQLVKSLKSWQEKRAGLVKGMSKQPSTAGPWLAVG